MVNTYRVVVKHKKKKLSFVLQADSDVEANVQAAMRGRVKSIKKTAIDGVEIDETKEH